MPRNNDERLLKKRRSSRLKDREVAATKAGVAAYAKSISAPITKRMRNTTFISTSLNARGDDESTSTMKLPLPSGSDSRRSQRITYQEFAYRERSLSQKEEDFKSLSEDLEQRILSLEKKENEISMMMSRSADREKETVLRQLEENFLCSLCYEVLAAPYSLNPSHCGHTFCGLCILKWFFSRLHRHCGTWHESVDCPMCRSLLIITPDQVHRPHYTFPFVPNRVTASFIESLVAKLAEQPSSSQAKIKREEFEGTCASQSRKTRRGCVRKRDESEGGDSVKMAAETLGMAAWRDGGRMRAEWLERDREGKEEMRNLLDCWTTMRAQDFIQMKEKLGV